MSQGKIFLPRDILPCDVLPCDNLLSVIYFVYWTRRHRLEMTRGLCSLQYCSPALLLFFQIDETKTVITQSFLKLEAPDFAWQFI